MTCPQPRKRKFRSPGAARRSGEQRYGSTPNVYRCQCGAWHITSQRTPQRDYDPAIERLAVALLGEDAA